MYALMGGSYLLAAIVGSLETLVLVCQIVRSPPPARHLSKQQRGSGVPPGGLLNLLRVKDPLRGHVLLCWVGRQVIQTG